MNRPWLHGRHQFPSRLKRPVDPTEDVPPIIAYGSNAFDCSPTGGNNDQFTRQV